MIRIGAATPNLRSVLDSPGFAWWYLDLVDDHGSGVVLIWSFGQPMVPGTAAGERRGDLPPARTRPSLNVVTYEHGECTSYLLQEVPREQVRWNGAGRFMFGRSAIHTLSDGENRVVRAILDCPVPGGSEPLRGVIEARCPEVQLVSDDDAHPHQWRPLGVAGSGSAALSVGDWHFSLQGRAYHDRNSSAAPLGDLGIDHWVWGRVPVADGERIYYLLWPEDGGQPIAMGLEVDARGRVTRHALDIDTAGVRWGRFGMPWRAGLQLTAGGEPWLTVQHRPPVDDGPYYLRFLTDVTLPDGTRTVGVGEGVRPGRRDNWAGPLTQMAVDRGKDSSIWLPLFSGPAATRWQRLAGVALPTLASGLGWT